MLNVHIGQHLATLEADREVGGLAVVTEIVAVFPTLKLEVATHKVACLVTLQREPLGLEILEIARQLRDVGQVLCSGVVSTIQGYLKLIECRLHIVLCIIQRLGHICLETRLELERGEEEHLLLGAVNLLAQDLPLSLLVDKIDPHRVFFGVQIIKGVVFKSESDLKLD